jgi:hypothetical protein
MTQNNHLQKYKNLILFPVGRSHRNRQIKKRAYVELRIVILEVLSDMCGLDDDGNKHRNINFHRITHFDLISILAGIVAWSKLLDVIYHVLFECIDGNDAQFL